MIRLENITYKIQDGVQEKVILDDVSCVFDDKCLTAITGHNGSGKSTLTKIILGIVQPTSGKVWMDGQDVTDLKVYERVNLGLSYAFQQPINFKGITIKDLIDIATKTNNSIPKACEYLSKVGLCAKEYINRDFDKNLSGGEQKRIELALAFAKESSHCIFDEPEAGIDLWSFEKLNSIFDKSKCNIVVSHQEKLLSMADKILVMQNGKIKTYGDKIDVLKDIKKTRCSAIGGTNEIR